MALSRVIAVGNGVTRNFTVNFALGYISTSDVTCRVGTEADGAGNPVYRSITWNSPGIATVSGAIPAPGVLVVFDRTVPRDKLVVDFENGAVMNDYNLNTAQKQAIMLAHEVLDGRITKLDNNLNMGAFRITGLGTPVEHLDAANKAYVDGRVTTSGTNATRAEVAAAASEQSNQQSASRAAAASASASAAYQSEQTASARAAAALVSQNAAATNASATSADRTAVSQDRQTVQSYTNLTSADRTATGNDRTAVRADAVQTAADRVATGNDRTAVRADAVQTAADRVATGNDRTQTGADRTQTGQDRTATAASVTKAQEWAVKPEDQAVETGLYSAYHWAKKAQAYAGGNVEMDSVVGLNSALAAKVAKAGDSMTGALTLSNGGNDSRAPLRFTSMTGTLTVTDGDMWMLNTGLWVRYGGVAKNIYDTGNAPAATTAEIATPTGTSVRMLTPANVQTIAAANANLKVSKTGGDGMAGPLTVTGASAAAGTVNIQQNAASTAASLQMLGPGGANIGRVYTNTADSTVRIQAFNGSDFLAVYTDGNIRTMGRMLFEYSQAQYAIRAGEGRLAFVNGNTILYHWNGADLHYKIDAMSSWRRFNYTDASDSRLKKNIQENNESGLDLVKQLRPVTFEYKQNTNLELLEGNRYGFLAQELQLILPNAVKDFTMPESDVTRLGLTSDAPVQLIAVLVKAIKELSAQVDALKKE